MWKTVSVHYVGLDCISQQDITAFDHFYWLHVHVVTWNWSQQWLSLAVTKKVKMVFTVLLFTLCWADWTFPSSVILSNTEIISVWAWAWWTETTCNFISPHKSVNDQAGPHFEHPGITSILVSFPPKSSAFWVKSLTLKEQFETTSLLWNPWRAGGLKMYHKWYFLLPP